MEKMPEKNRFSHTKSKKRTFICVLIFLVGCFSYFFYFLYDVVSQGFRDLGQSQFRDNNIEVNKEPFAILLIGADGRKQDSENWRPDTLMVVTVNPKEESLRLVSIPRDTYTTIANTNIETKINAAAHYGYQNNINPIQNIRQTVENLLQIPIDYYIKANFDGFTKAVDLLGGVDVNVPYDFTEKTIGKGNAVFTKGPMHLDGPNALAYVRMRKKDPMGDHGRNIRQQEVLTQLADKIVSLNGLSHIVQLVRTLGENITFNIKPTQIPLLTQIYSRAKHNLETLRINTTPWTDNGICYEWLEEKEKERICSALQDHLEFSRTREYVFSH